MHPISKTNFGIHGVVVRYYNGSAMTNGYIVKQLGTIKYNVTDGSNPRIVTLAQTAAQVSALGSTSPTIATIPVSGSAGAATGATFTPVYGLDNTTSITAGGTGYTANDTLTITGGVRASGTVTVGTVVATNTVTINGVVVTVVASGATGPQVNTGTPTAVAAALYSWYTGNANSVINYAVNGPVLTCIAKTSGTGGNAFTLASTANFTTSGATLTGGAADVASAPSTATAATVSGGVVTSLGSLVAGTWPSVPTGPVYAYYATNGRTPVTVTAKFKINSITASGGTGYVPNNVLMFNGMTATSSPAAHVTTTGAATNVALDSPGAGITSGASSIGVLGVAENVRVLFDSVAQTVTGTRVAWNLGAPINGSSVIGKYS